MGPASNQDTLRVAVVGTGCVPAPQNSSYEPLTALPARVRLAGLATAYLLQTTPLYRQDGSRIPVEVHVFDQVRGAEWMRWGCDAKS